MLKRKAISDSKITEEMILKVPYEVENPSKESTESSKLETIV